MDDRFAAILCLAFCLSAGCIQQVESPKPEQANNSRAEPLSEWVGERVQIQFRRDVLGAAREYPVGPEVSSINGNTTSLFGELVSVTSKSLVIKSDGNPHWIPLDMILYVEVQR